MSESTFMIFMASFIISGITIIIINVVFLIDLYRLKKRLKEEIDRVVKEIRGESNDINEKKRRK